MTRAMFGTAVGVALGLALVFAGFGAMLIVALSAAVGFVVAKVTAGEIDVVRYLQGNRSNR